MLEGELHYIMESKQIKNAFSFTLLQLVYCLIGSGGSVVFV